MCNAYQLLPPRGDPTVDQDLAARKAVPTVHEAEPEHEDDLGWLDHVNSKI
jgi:hypothetical protein